MAVSVTYNLQFIQNLDLLTGPTLAGVDVTELANGGFAAVGQRSSGFSSLDLVNANLASAGGQATAGLVGSAIDQLADGNIVVVSTGAQNTGYLSILNGSGQFVRNLDFFTTTGEAASIDVAALAGGGFVAVTGSASGTVALRICSSAGAELAYIPVDSGDKYVPVVAALDDGGFAIAWEFHDIGRYNLYCKVYNANGSVRHAQQLIGTSTNSRFGDMDMTATNSGFAIVLQDDTPNNDITLSLFDANGNFMGITTNVSQNSYVDANPTVTRLSNGMLAVGMQTLRGADNDDFVNLIDPNTGAILAYRSVVAGEGILDEVRDVAVTGLSLGRLAVFHTNLTDNDVDGEALQGVRTMTSDGAGDSMVGDDFVDILLGNGGADFLYGNNNNDQLYGGAGVDYMSGGNGNDYMSGGSEKDTFFGGAGVDTIIGGAGDDDYYVQIGDASDIIVEYAGEGNDRILSAISYSLGAGVEIETLSTDANSGTNSINLTGSNLANTIIGNNGVNILDGRGGNDILYGLGGTDYFAFSVAPNSASNIDYIIGFLSVDDLIFLDDAVFSSLSPGTLSATYFRSANGAVAAIGAERIVHNPLTGDLHWDADGVGGVGPVRFANIGAGTVLFNYDFFVN